MQYHIKQQCKEENLLTGQCRWERKLSKINQNEICEFRHCLGGLEHGLCLHFVVNPEKQNEHSLGSSMQQFSHIEH